MPLKHSTIPAGADQPGFTGVTPSIWAQQHTFSGGTQGSVLAYNTSNSDNTTWIESLAGIFASSGTDTLPSFTSTIATTLNFSTIHVKSLILDQTTANYTVSWANPASARVLTINDPLGNDTFAFLAAAQTFTNKTLTAPILSGTVTGTYTMGGTVNYGTITTGTWSASFGAVSGANLTNLTAGNITGSHTLPDGVLSTNVPLLASSNTFTANQTIALSAGGGSLTMAGTVSTGETPKIIFRTGSGHKAFLLTAQNNVADALEITPSTANGGTTFSTPILTLTAAGIFSVLSNGPHVFAGGGPGNVVVQIQNTLAGTTNGAQLQLLGNTASVNLSVRSSTYTPTSSFDFTNGFDILNTGSGGISLASSHATGGTIGFYTAGAVLAHTLTAAALHKFGAASTDPTGAPSSFTLGAPPFTGNYGSNTTALGAPDHWIGVILSTGQKVIIPAYSATF